MATTGTGSIPMGGPFSTQSADLHTVWRVKLSGRRNLRFGRSVSLRRGVPSLDTPYRSKHTAGYRRAPCSGNQRVAVINIGAGGVVSLHNAA